MLKNLPINPSNIILNLFSNHQLFYWVSKKSCPKCIIKLFRNWIADVRIKNLFIFVLMNVP